VDARSLRPWARSIGLRAVAPVRDDEERPGRLHPDHWREAARSLGLHPQASAPAQLLAGTFRLMASSQRPSLFAQKRTSRGHPVNREQDP
jgi:hypothetical protein